MTLPVFFGTYALREGRVKTRPYGGEEPAPQRWTNCGAVPRGATRVVAPQSGQSQGGGKPRASVYSAAIYEKEGAWVSCTFFPLLRRQASAIHIDIQLYEKGIDALIAFGPDFAAVLLGDGLGDGKA